MVQFVWLNFLMCVLSSYAHNFVFAQDKKLELSPSNIPDIQCMKQSGQVHPQGIDWTETRALQKLIQAQKIQPCEKYIDKAIWLYGTGGYCIALPKSSYSNVQCTLVLRRDLNYNTPAKAAEGLLSEFKRKLVLRKTLSFMIPNVNTHIFNSQAAIKKKHVLIPMSYDLDSPKDPVFESEQVFYGMQCMNYCWKADQSCLYGNDLKVSFLDIAYALDVFKPKFTPTNACQFDLQQFSEALDRYLALPPKMNAAVSDEPKIKNAVKGYKDPWQKSNGSKKDSNQKSAH